VTDEQTDHATVTSIAINRIAIVMTPNVLCRQAIGDAIKFLLPFPPHLKGVATQPC